jgi:hypothetical protein
MLFVTSSLAHSIASYLSSDPVEYDFALLSTAVGLVYAYGIGVPVMFWVALRYLGISEGWAVVETVAVWGYAMFVWIPVSVRDPSFALVIPSGPFFINWDWTRFFFIQILCIIPIALLRWILSGIGFALSGYFLVANIYPVLVSVRHLISISPIALTLSPLNVGGSQGGAASDCCDRCPACRYCALIQGLIL